MRFFIISLLALTQFASAFEPEEDGVFAVFDTSMGEFTAKIAFKDVPLTTANFVGLAEGKIPRFDPATGDIVSTGPFYDGKIFHVVIDDFAIFAGDPEPDDDTIDGPGYTITDETHRSLWTSRPYAISMLNNYCAPCEQNGQVWDIGENTGGSQFFITLDPPNGNIPTYLDGHYSTFGIIVDGEDIVEAIGDVSIDPITERPIEDVVINSVTIVREGEEALAYDPTSFELPVLQYKNDLISVRPESDSVKFDIQVEEQEDLVIRKSEDLSTWTDMIANNAAGSNSLYTVDGEDATELFLRVLKPIGPIDYQERIPNARFTANMVNNLIGPTWIFEFNDNIDDFDNENGFGVIKVEGKPNAFILGYEYHRLPNGARLRIVSQSLHVITFNLRYSAETSGNMILWTDDYLNGNPLRYPTSGTFELTIP